MLDGVLSRVLSGQPVGAQFWEFSGRERGAGAEFCLKLCLLVTRQPFCDKTGSRSWACWALAQACCWAALRSALLKGSPVFLQTMLTAISMSAIATNGVVPGKGVLEAGWSEMKPSFCEQELS